MSDRQCSRVFAAGLVISVAVFALTVARQRGPAPRSAEADGFSAIRAKALLDRVLAGGRPHPAGTAENRRVRDRIVAHLRGLGYDPQVDRRWECFGWADCAEVENILVRREGSSGEAVLLAAHYDSVGAGPGASDDGAGLVALLEIARLLKDAPPPRNPVIFLISDGEEAGLIGAAAFMNQHPWAREVRAAINLEARGTSGASFMFETSRGNGWLIAQMRRFVEYPLTSSLYYGIYERLPNDTDFTVFKAAGVQGVNFAFIGGVARYHTPRDVAANLSLRSLQHHGQNALAMTRALASADLTRARSADAVYFDLFGWQLIAFPASWMPALVILSVVLLATGASVLRRRGLGLTNLAWGALAAVVSIVLAIAVAFGGHLSLRAAGVAPSPWVASPGPALGFFYMAPFGMAILMARWAGSRARLGGLWFGGAFVWTALAVVSFVLLPSGAFVFVFPALAMSAAMFSRGGFLDPLAVLIASTFSFAVAWPLYDAMGLAVMPAVGLLVALVALTVVPHVTGSGRSMRRVVTVAAIAAPVIALVIAFFLPPFAAGHPRRASLLLHHDAERNQSRWLVRAGEGPLPQSLRRAAAWQDGVLRPFGWDTRAGYFAAPAPAQSLPLPEHSVQRHGAVSRVRIKPLGDPSKIALVVRDAGIESVTVNGRRTTPDSPRRQRAAPAGWLRIVLHTVPPEGAVIEIVSTSARPLEGFIEQRWLGLPPAAAPIQSARPADAVPSQDGDFAVVIGRM